MAEAFTGLYAAWRLFLRDPRGITLLDPTPVGALRSFWCALVVLPAYALIVILVHPLGMIEVDWFRFTLVEVVTYAVSWCAWPLLMFYVTQALDRTDRYFLYVTAFNWSAGPQVVIWLIVLIVVFSGVVSHEVATIINIAALVVILLYHLFILRTTLKLSLFVSIGLVAGEAMLTQFIELIRVSMMR